MRFYDGAHDELIKLAKAATYEEPYMFILPEVNNTTDPNAVMLSNGRRKIGSVAAGEAGKLRRIFAEWRHEMDFDEVLVVDFVRTPIVHTAYDCDNFKHVASIKVRGIYRVHERLARKFAQFSR